MADGIDMELALELLNGFCKSNSTELTDLLHVAQRLKGDGELSNLSVGMINRTTLSGYIGPREVEIKADYNGERILFVPDADINSYFADLGIRVGLEFQNARFISGNIPNPGQKGNQVMIADAKTPSGKPLMVELTQHYTYEQAELARQTRNHR